MATSQQEPQGEGPAPNGIYSDKHLVHQYQVPGKKL